ncbi:DUF2812 domain-containing protein [Paenibacillus sp. N1-5-1-14]|uniref:DUF2812 domain-containing protein n=1 Tax=Paenibacillus radicibacter TaxID=2972488 RepID=UPI002158C7F4|nr:DUF2812 domain-containing protein [Paenibacillus radicibacter]MCR8643413.1 DUF2812 domain-containing protein [Paenibacillus radicibacter]
MRAYKFFVNFDKEERWLNEMASKGYILSSKNVGYKFGKGSPEKANYRMDYRIFNKREDFEDYRALYEDSGWRHIAGTKSSGAQYFKQMDEFTTDDIFSDSSSKAGRYDRIARMWSTIFILFLAIMISSLANQSLEMATLVNPKLWYQTPGLWEKSGMEFFRALAFETPFALTRGLGYLTLPACMIIYLIFTIKAKSAYKHTNGGAM